MDKTMRFIEKMARQWKSLQAMKEWIKGGRVEGAYTSSGLPRFKQPERRRGGSKLINLLESERIERERKSLWAALLEDNEKTEETVYDRIQSLISTDNAGSADLVCLMERWTSMPINMLGWEDSVQLNDKDMDEAKILFKEMMAARGYEKEAFAYARKCLLEKNSDKEFELDYRINQVIDAEDPNEDDAFDMRFRGGQMKRGFDLVEKIKYLADQNDWSFNDVMAWNKAINEARFGGKDKKVKVTHMKPKGMTRAQLVELNKKRGIKGIKDLVKNKSVIEVQEPMHRENRMPYVMWLAARIILQMQIVKLADSKKVKATAASNLAKALQQWRHIPDEQDMRRIYGKNWEKFEPESPEMRFNRYRTEQLEMKGEQKLQQPAASGNTGLYHDRWAAFVDFSNYIRGLAKANKMTEKQALTMYIKENDF